MIVPIINNISLKEVNEISKYKNLQIEIEKMWYLKTTTVPVIEGALGMIKKETDRHINGIPGSPSLYEIQKILFRGTVYLLWKVPSMYVKDITQKRQQKIWIEWTKSILSLR